jgi:hypothetical protein
MGIGLLPTVTLPKGKQSKRQLLWGCVFITNYCINKYLAFFRAVFSDFEYLCGVESISITDDDE